jgi:hypothetical protein
MWHADRHKYSRGAAVTRSASHTTNLLLLGRPAAAGRRGVKTSAKRLTTTTRTQCTCRPGSLGPLSTWLANGCPRLAQPSPQAQPQCNPTTARPSSPQVRCCLFAQHHHGGGLAWGQQQCALHRAAGRLACMQSLPGRHSSHRAGAPMDRRPGSCTPCCTLRAAAAQRDARCTAGCSARRQAVLSLGCHSCECQLNPNVQVELVLTQGQSLSNTQTEWKGHAAAARLAAQRGARRGRAIACSQGEGGASACAERDQQASHAPAIMLSKKNLPAHNCCWCCCCSR